MSTWSNKVKLTNQVRKTMKQMLYFIQDRSKKKKPFCNTGVLEVGYIMNIVVLLQDNYIMRVFITKKHLD